MRRRFVIIRLSTGVGGCVPWRGRVRSAFSRRRRDFGEYSLENKESGPQAFLEFVNQRLAKRQRELEDAVKFSSHYVQVESIVLELKTLRTKFVTYMRREGLL